MNFEVVQFQSCNALESFHCEKAVFGVLNRHLVLWRDNARGQEPLLYMEAPLNQNIFRPEISMHEASLVQALIRILEEEGKRHKVERITRVHLEIGLFTAVEPQTFMGCFELLAEGTLAEGAVLEIKTVPASGTCLDCGQVFPINSARCRCPHCGGMRLDGTGGREFNITSIEAC